MIYWALIQHGFINLTNVLVIIYKQNPLPQLYLLIEKHFAFLMETTPSSFLQSNENESLANSGKG